METARPINRACPSLGLIEDADTSLDFPSNQNYCHRANPIAAPRFSHQEGFCLGGKYKQCPLFLSAQPAPLPQDLQIPRAASHPSRMVSRTYLALTVLTLFIVVLAAGWSITRRGMLPIESLPTSGGTAFAPLTPSPTDASATSLFPFSIINTTSSPTSVASTANLTNPPGIPGKHQLDVPIGTDYKFVIHKVMDGESLINYAEQYDTSLAAILALNYLPLSPLWSGTLVVIPIGVTDFASLPGFKVYRVKEIDRGISVDDLAKYLQVSALDLKYYNGWTQPGDRPLVGDYLLVPHPRPAPTSTRTPRPTATPTRTATSTRTPTRTNTSIPTLNPSKHQLDMPIGGQYKFVIHKVQGGETFNQYADKYQTTVEAILLATYNLKSPLWVDAFVIIPVGFTDVGSLPVFEAFQVTKTGQSLESLALELGVSVQDLKYYNGIGAGESLLLGDWLLVPRPRSAL